jgi:hypothetical protein
MSTERPQRHVLDELLAKSVQAPPSRGLRVHAEGTSDEPAPIERTAPPEEPRWPAHPALERVDSGGEEDREEPARREQERGGPILRDTRSRLGPQRRREGFGNAESEVQVGRGPLALHLSRAATEERLAESEERLAQSEKRFHEARRELEDREARLASAGERLTQSVERLTQAEKRLAALEERLMMTEESERHAVEQQARAEESREVLAAQIATMEARERELREETDAERAAHARVASELERLRGSFATLTPLVHALHEATGEIQTVLAHDPEAGTAHGGGGDAGGGGGTAQTPPAPADSPPPQPEPTGAPWSAPRGSAGTPGAAGTAADGPAGTAGQASPAPAPSPQQSSGGATPSRATSEHGEAGLLGALVEVVERWRAHGAA